MAHDSTGHDHAHDDHDDDHHHEEPAPPEPTTPGWVTLLGACLFLLGGIFLVLASTDSTDEKSDAAAATGAAPALRPSPLQQHGADDGHGH